MSQFPAVTLRRQFTWATLPHKVTAPAPARETVYSGPAPEPRPPRIADPPAAEVEQIERDLNEFTARVFAWITGALLISAFFASYSDRWNEDVPSFITGQVLCLLVGGMVMLAFVISRKVEKMMPSVAMATLIAYAAMQGSLFGLTYRAAYHASLAPVYVAMSLVFGLLWIHGHRSGKDLTGIRSLITGAVLAIALAVIFRSVFELQTIAVCCICVCSWLMLALVGYHRDLLRDLPSTFEDDLYWQKAAAVGALQIYLDLVTIVAIVIQARWMRESWSELTADKSKN